MRMMMMMMMIEMLCFADTCSPFSYMLPKLTVKTASSDNAPSISKSFVALPPPPAAVTQSQPSTMATVDAGGGVEVATDPEVVNTTPAPPPPRRLPSPPATDSTITDRSQSQPGWHVVSATLNSPRHRRSRPAASSRLRDLNANSGSAEERPSVKTCSSADWLRLIEKLGDAQFGEVGYVTSRHVTSRHASNILWLAQVN